MELCTKSLKWTLSIHCRGHEEEKKKTNQNNHKKREEINVVRISAIVYLTNVGDPGRFVLH
jgi:hypothetical protein